MVYRLNKNVFAQITLYSGETINQNFGYDVEIINKECGKVTERRFPFSAHLKSHSLSAIQVKEGSWITDLDEESINILSNKIIEYIKFWE
jgi:hypothetical protein